MPALRQLCNVATGPLRMLRQPPRGLIPALDFLRSCAVLFVLAMHLRKPYLAGGGHANFFSEQPFVRAGWIGVDLFFVLSGFLIGKELWRELRQTGTIDYRQFFLRRSFRIWPLYGFFLVLVLTALGRGDWSSGRGWTDAVFLTNYVNQGVVMGSWSLCSEEQFYLLAPLSLLLLRPAAASVGQYRKYLWALFLLLPAGRLVTWWCLTGGVTSHDNALFARRIYTPLHTHSDGLVLGLLLSNYAATAAGGARAGFFASGWSVLAALGACVGLRAIQREVFEFTGTTLFFGALLWFLLARPGRWGAFVGWGGFYLLSRLSFGMYLNHEYFQDHVAELALRYLPLADSAPALHHAVTTALFVVVSAALSVVTFCAVEYPFLQLRKVALRRQAPAAARRPTPVLGMAAPRSRSVVAS